MVREPAAKAGGPGSIPGGFPSWLSSICDAVQFGYYQTISTDMNECLGPIYIRLSLESSCTYTLTLSTMVV